MTDDRLRPNSLTVRQGGWRLDLRGDEVADVEFDGVRLLRGIRPVVRDQDWNTVPTEVLTQQVTQRGESWEATVELRFRDGNEIVYDATLTLRMDPTTLTVRFAGMARTAFRRNRIGLVILHPIAESGRAVDLRTTAGAVVASRWPEQISPHQPFREVAGLGWTRGHVHADLQLDGDVFETEDQRNWTDASFKTYSTPLDLPFPIEVQVGDEVHQSAVLAAAIVATSTATSTASPAPAATPVVVTTRHAGMVPRLALGASPAGHRSTAVPGPWAAVLVELTGDPSTWDPILAAAAAEAEQLGAALDLRVVSADPAAVRHALAHPAARRAHRVAVFDPTSHVTTPTLWRALTEQPAESVSAGSLIAGARSHFTELNRQFDQLPAEPPLTFSITPQMHATEVAHLVESLEGQRQVVRDAARLAAGRPLHIGPITLRPRFNAVATTESAPPLWPDPLQGEPFAAAWTLGSVAALAHPDVHSLTYFTAHGPGGIYDDDGVLTPAGDILHRLAALSGAPVLITYPPPGVVAYAVDRGSAGIELFLANLTDEVRPVAVFGGPARPVVVTLTRWGTAVLTIPVP